MDTALAWRQTTQGSDVGGLSRISAYPQELPDTELLRANRDIERSADEIAASHSPFVARSFYAVATGIATPLLQHVDAWLLEGGAKGPLDDGRKHSIDQRLTALPTGAVNTISLPYSRQLANPSPADM